MSQRSFVEILIIDFCAIMSSSVSTQQMCRGMHVLQTSLALCCLSVVVFNSYVQCRRIDVV